MCMCQMCSNSVIIHVQDYYRYSVFVDRLKSFSFNEQDLTIEIPKPLQLADVAVRVVWPPLTQQLDKETVIDAGSDGDTPKQEGDNTDTMEKSSTAVEPVENAESNDQPTEVCVCVFVCVCNVLHASMCA